MVVSSEQSPNPSSASLLPPSEAAFELGVSPATIRRWLHEGRISGERVGGRLRVAPGSLMRMREPIGGAP